MKSTTMYRALALATLATLALGGCGGKSTTTTTTATQPNAYAATAAPATETGSADINCGAVKPVWANTKSKVYHEQGDPLYGHTKHGKYMCPSAAMAAGYHLARGSRESSSMRGRHRKHDRSSDGSSGAMATPTP